MAESAYLPRVSVRGSDVSESPEHTAVVRITHWIHSAAFLALLVSGIAILISHPRLYWGETGNWETPSLIDLPLPFVLAGQNGWGRYLHFLAAWVAVFTGLFYVLSGVFTQHFRRNLLPAARDLTRDSLSQAVAFHLSSMRGAREEPITYNVLQRLAYLGVVFILFPVLLWTGLAMSPAITSVFPLLVEILGGQQSARTIHFFLQPRWPSLS